jgi:hypothetical protein
MLNFLFSRQNLKCKHSAMLQIMVLKHRGSKRIVGELAISEIL